MRLEVTLVVFTCQGALFKLATYEAINHSGIPNSSFTGRVIIKMQCQGPMPSSWKNIVLPFLWSAVRVHMILMKLP